MIYAATAVLLAALWPFAALWFQTPFRRTFPRLAVYLGLALLLATAAILASAFALPTLTLAAAPVALAAILAQLWRARPSFGASKNLPPGELKVLPAQAWLDPDFYQKQFETYGPVFKSSHFLQPMVCIVGLDIGFEALREHEGNALVPPEASFARYIPCSYIRSMSDADHKHYRPILQAAISSEVNDALAPQVAECLKRHLDRMAADGAPRLGQYAREALYEALFLLFYGVQPGSPDALRLRDLYRTLDLAHQRRATVWSPADAKVRRALDETLEILRRNIGNEPSYLQAAKVHDDTVLLNLVFLLQVTCTDLAGLFDWIVKKLTENPVWAARLRAGDDPTLGRRIISEVFRLEQSEHIYRKVAKPFQLRGYTIPKGWLFRICVRESHHTAPHFENPEQFNPDRFLNRTYGPTEYAPFGMFRRRCIGVDTGLALGSILAKTLVDHYTWEVTNPGRPEFRGWHWTPGTAFAIRLATAPPKPPVGERL